MEQPIIIYGNRPLVLGQSSEIGACQFCKNPITDKTKASIFEYDPKIQFLAHNECAPGIHPLQARGEAAFLSTFWRCRQKGFSRSKSLVMARGAAGGASWCTAWIGGGDGLAQFGITHPDVPKEAYRIIMFSRRV